MTPNNELQKSIQNLWDKINHISGTLKLFNEQKQSLEIANEEIQNEYNSLSEQFEATQNNLNSTIINNDKDQNRIAELENTLLAKNDIINGLRKNEATLNELQAEFNILKTKYDSIIFRNAELENEINDQANKLNQFSLLSDENLALKNENKLLENKSSDFEFSKLEIIRKNKDIYEKNNVIKNLKDKVSELESLSFELIRIKEENIKKCEKERELNQLIEDYKAQISMLNIQLEIEKKKLDDKNKEYNSNLINLENDLKDTRLSLSELQKELSETKLRLQTVINNYNISLNESEDYLAKINLQSFKIKELDSLIFDYILEIQKLNDEKGLLQNIQAENYEYLDKIYKLEEEIKEISNLKEIINIKNEELIKFQNLNNQNTKDIESLNSENTLLKNEIDKLKSNIIDFNNKFEEKVVNESKQDSLIQFYIDENNKSNNLIFELKNTLEHKNNEILKYQEELNINNKVNQNLKNTIQDNNNKLDDLEISNNNLLSKINEIQASCDKLKQQKFAVEANILLKDDEIIQLSTEKSNLEENINKLEIIIKNLESNSYNLLNENKDKIQELYDTINSLENENNNLNNIINQSNKEYKSIEDEINSIKEINNNLNKLVSEKENLILEKDKKISEINESQIKLQQELDKAKIDFINYKNSKNENENDNIIDELKDKLSKSNISLNRMRLESQEFIDKQEKTQKIKKEIIQSIEEFINNLN